MEDNQPWKIMLTQQEEIRSLKRKRLISDCKLIALSCLSAWVFLPIVLSLLPIGLKDIYSATHAWYSDVALGLQCKYHK